MKSEVQNEIQVKACASGFIIVEVPLTYFRAARAADWTCRKALWIAETIFMWPTYLRFPASITVYSAGSNVNVAPIATISGPNTHLAFPFGIALDSSDNIFVADFGRIIVFAAGSNGNVPPMSEFGDPECLLVEPAGLAIAP